MPRVLFFLLLPVLGIWSAYSWWQVRRARSAREKSFLARASLTVWMLVALFAAVFCVVPGKLQILVAALSLVVGAGVRRAWRTVRAKIRLEESDPLAHAKRVN